MDHLLAGTFNVPDLDVLAIAAFLTACGVIFMAARGVHRFGRRVNQFFDDWYGHEGDDNHPEQPGVLRRMTDIEANLAKHIDDEEAAIATLAGHMEAVALQVDEVKLKVGSEMNRNGGGSMKDAVHEALRAVREVQMQQEADVIAHREWRKSYDLDRANDERRRLALFAVIRAMISRAPAEQEAMFDQAIEAYAAGTEATTTEP